MSLLLHYVGTESVRKLIVVARRLASQVVVRRSEAARRVEVIRSAHVRRALLVVTADILHTIVESNVNFEHRNGLGNRRAIRLVLL